MFKSLSFLNIEYGSISFVRIFYSFLFSLSYFFLDNNKIEYKLIKIVKNRYKNNVFFLKNARSSLGFFLKSLGINKNDQVILSSFSCLAVPYGVLSCGAKPIYLDIDPSTLNFNLENLKKKINKIVKAVIVQHTLGKPADIISIKKYLKKKNIILIEDCALAIGSKLKDKNLGCYGDASIFSMELSKTISSGWGGVLLVNKKKLSKKIEKKYLLLNRESNVKSFLKHFQIFISIICYNKYLYFIGKYFYSLLYKLKIFKPSSLPEEKKGIIKDNFFEKLGRFQIIFAIVQWRSFDKIISKCVKNYNIIFNSLENLNIKVLPVATSNEFLVSNRISFLVKDRKKFIEYFQKNGVSIGKWFDGPLSPSPKSKLFNYNKKNFNSSVEISKKIVNLPCNSGISSSDCQRISILLNKYFLHHR